MIFLDTNVLAESMRRAPEPQVIDWLIRNDSEAALSIVVIAEIIFGIEKIHNDQRSPRLWTLLQDHRLRFRDRIFDFGEEDAVICGRIMGEASRTGRTMDMPDAMIAATALRHGAALATRNVKDFAVDGLIVIDPWAGEAGGG